MMASRSSSSGFSCLARAGRRRRLLGAVAGASYGRRLGRCVVLCGFVLLQADVAGCHDAARQFLIAAHTLECLLGCVLLALLLRETGSLSGFDVLQQGVALERHGVFLSRHFGLRGELDVNAVLLAPLDEFALVVFLAAGQILEVEVLVDDALLEEAEAVAVTTVKVNGTDKGFERVPGEVAVVRCAVDFAFYQPVESDFFGDLIERIALYDFASRRGEEAFRLLGNSADTPNSDISWHTSSSTYGR